MYPASTYIDGYVARDSPGALKQPHPLLMAKVIYVVRIVIRKLAYKAICVKVSCIGI